MVEIVAAVRDRTMVCEAGIRFTCERVVEAIDGDIPGVFVECGVWRGGIGIAMLLTQRQNFGKVLRPVHFMDGFIGLPPVQERDGPAAARWQANDPDNCRASKQELIEALKAFGFAPTDYMIWDGMFSVTLPKVAALVPQIAMLRIDCDWYASVMPCLETLMPNVSDGATVIVDDYFAWDGCARAVHDYLSRRDLPYRIVSLPDHSAAYFSKHAPN